MNNTNTGGPAFPTAAVFHDEVVYQGGMTLRDYFAAKAMQGLCSSGNTNAQEIGQAAYIVADAMLKARDA